MNMTIDGIPELLESLNNRIEKLEKRKLFLEKLAEIGIQEAEERLEIAEYDGTNDVHISKTPEWIDANTLAICADGEAVTFIEFGTGVHNPGTHPMADKLGMIRGEYGHKQGRREWWTYRGEPGTNGEVLENGKVKTRGNNANRFMWEGAELMRSKIKDIATEVFAND